MSRPCGQSGARPPFPGRRPTRADESPGGALRGSPPATRWPRVDGAVRGGYRRWLPEPRRGPSGAQRPGEPRSTSSPPPPSAQGTGSVLPICRPGSSPLDLVLVRRADQQVREPSRRERLPDTRRPLGACPPGGRCSTALGGTTQRRGASPAPRDPPWGRAVVAAIRSNAAAGAGGWGPFSPRVPTRCRAAAAFEPRGHPNRRSFFCAVHFPLDRFSEHVCSGGLRSAGRGA